MSIITADKFMRKIIEIFTSQRNKTSEIYLIIIGLLNYILTENKQQKKNTEKTTQPNQHQI